MRPGTTKLLVCLTIVVVAISSSLAATGTASNSKPVLTPQDVFDGMRHSFRADKAKGVHAKYQWELRGPNGGEWWVDVEDGKYRMGRGRIANADVTFISSDKDWVAISNGKLKGTWAYLTGRLKVRGSHAVARKLDEIFP